MHFKLRRFFKKRSTKIVLSILILVVLISVIYLLFLYLRNKNNQEAITRKAQEINSDCSNLSNKEGCYSDAFYHLTQETNLVFAKSVLLELQKLDPQHGTGCHFIAHMITQGAAEKAPDKLEDLLAQITPYECTGGYIHGLIEAYISNNYYPEINPETMHTICNKFSKDKGYAMLNCYHILGHITLVETKGDINKGIDKCVQLENANHRDQCLSGVFMENLTRENLTSHQLAKPLDWNEENTLLIERMCKNYSGHVLQACWKELSYMYITLSKSDPSELYRYCQRAPNEKSALSCFIYGTGNLIHFSDFDKNKIAEVCAPLTESNLNAHCINHLLGSLIAGSVNNLDHAIKLCQSSADPKRCFDQIIFNLKQSPTLESYIVETCNKIDEENRPYLCS